MDTPYVLATAGPGYRSSIAPRTGFTSAIGVPSIASRPLTCRRSPSMLSTRTRCRPIGLGRLADRVLKTPCSGRLWSPLGCTVNVLRSAWCSQVRTMIVVPNRNAVQSRLHTGVQDQVRLRSSFIALPGCIGGHREWTLDTSYGTNYEVDTQVVCHVVTLTAPLGSHRSPPSSGVAARYLPRFSAQGHEGTR